MPNSARGCQPLPTFLQPLPPLPPVPSFSLATDPVAVADIISAGDAAPAAPTGDTAPAAPTGDTAPAAPPGDTAPADLGFPSEPPGLAPLHNPQDNTAVDLGLSRANRHAILQNYGQTTNEAWKKRNRDIKANGANIKDIDMRARLRMLYDTKACTDAMEKAHKDSERLKAKLNHRDPDPAIPSAETSAAIAASIQAISDAAETAAAEPDTDATMTDATITTGAATTNSPKPTTRPHPPLRPPPPSMLGASPAYDFQPAGFCYTPGIEGFAPSVPPGDDAAITVPPIRRRRCRPDIGQLPPTPELGLDVTDFETKEVQREREWAEWKAQKDQKP